MKAYLRRGTARESLLFYKEALQGEIYVCLVGYIVFTDLRLLHPVFCAWVGFIVLITDFLFVFLCISDFKHALVLEPQNKVANLAEKRLRKLVANGSI